MLGWVSDAFDGWANEPHKMCYMDKAATNEGFDARIREDLVVSVARIFFDGNSARNFLYYFRIILPFHEMKSSCKALRLMYRH